MDLNAYMIKLLAAHPLRASTLRAVIETLQLSSGRRGLAAGRGIGLQCLLLVEAVGRFGHATEIDVSPEF